MKLIIGDAVVSCYVDAASLLVMILLLCLSERIRRRKNENSRVFFLLCLQIAFTCIVCFVFNAMEGHTTPLSHAAALVSRTLWELCSIMTDCLWLTYVHQKLYGERHKRRMLQYLRAALFTVYSVLLIINLFNGMVFSISDDNRLVRKPLFYVLIAADFLIFLSAAISVWRYDRKTQKIRFIRVSPMILSLFLSILPQFFTPYNVGIIGYVTGITLLYFSIAGESRYIDEESGLYNKTYLAYLFDLALAEKNDVRSVLILEAEGCLPAAVEILKKQLHQQGDVIRTEENKFMMFSGIDSRSTMQYQTSLVDEAVERHNAEHPEEKVQMTVYCRMRTPKQDAFEFLRTSIEGTEGGNEMRGIVSMMSELDRLDKELALAADIQINILPTNFPAFPDRKEFDLYASTTPAKEVGGDFYDFFLIDSDHLALVIADVSGKGIPAALFMMVSKTLIKNQLMSGCDPAAALEHVNVQLCERNSSMMFVTVWLAVLEISTGKGLACNAGHENPGFRPAGGDFELLKYKHGVFVGVSPKARYQNREFSLNPGDGIFVYTDGVPEATNGGNEMFGEERTKETLNRDPDAAPEELVRRMGEAVNRFADGAPQFDDITMLCMKYFGAQE